MENLRTLLIDPFQKRLHEIELSPHIQDWHKWCDCEAFDYAYCGTHEGQRQDIWVDDNGLNRHPMYPTFKWRDRDLPLVGYGLLLGTTPGGDSVSTILSIEYVLSLIAWEQWEVRLNPADWFDQLSRIYYFRGNSR